MGYITVDAEDEFGAMREVLVDSANPPKIGDWFEDEGERVRRVPSAPEVRTFKYECDSYQLPRLKDARKIGFPEAPHYKDGRPAFDSKREIDNYVARHNADGRFGQIQWNPDGNE